MNTDQIVVLTIVYAVVLVGGYVWLSIALSRVFPKLGEEGWKAWVPVLREMTVLQLGGYSAAWVVALFLPFINIIGLVVTVLAVHQINIKLGRGPAFTVLAVIAYPVWATIVGFGNAPRTPGPVVVQNTGYQPFAALPQAGGATGAIAGPPAAAPALTFGEGSPFAPAPPVPPRPAAPAPAAAQVPPAPPRALSDTPPAPPQTAGQIAFQPVARVAPPAPPVAPAPSAAAPSRLVTPPPAPPTLAPPAPVDRAPAADPWSAPAPATAPAPVVIPPIPAPPAIAPVPADSCPAASSAAPAAFPTLPTSSADGVFDDAPAAQSDAPADRSGEPLRHDLSARDADNERTITPAAAPESFESDLDDDFEDTVIVNRREELWVLSPEGADPIRVTRPVALLGRNPSVSAEHPDAQLIRLTDPARTVSKTHARIELVSGAWLIIDLGSTNGVYLSDDGTDVELESNVPTTLTEAFRLGELPFRLERGE